MSSSSRTVLFFLSGLAAGMILTVAAVKTMAPSMMIHEGTSPMDVDSTVEAIRANAESLGWKVPKVYNFQETILKEGLNDIGPMRVVELCQPTYASGLLSDPGNKRVGVMMPCAFAVYEGADGRTRVASMNVGLMGKLFGGAVADAMGRVSGDDEKILSFLE